MTGRCILISAIRYSQYYSRSLEFRNLKTEQLKLGNTMGLFDLFKSKPTLEKVTGDVCAKAGYKPFVTVQLFAGIDAQYIYLVGKTFVSYEIGKYNTSNIRTYETRELAGQGLTDFLKHTKSMGFTNIVHIGNGAHNALVEGGISV